MKILIGGATGFIGSALVPFLRKHGHEVIILTRKKEKSDGIFWDPNQFQLDGNELEGFDAVINLAGENIAAGRWTVERKRKILDSRTETTRLLCKTLAKLKKPPQVLLNASAIGYYGYDLEKEVDEAAAKGNGFLAEVCEQWENATQPAKEAGIRTVIMRFGIVLSPKGGALAKMLKPFKWGLAGIVGSGKQWVSWIALDDLLGAVAHFLNHPECEGPFNVVSPSPVRNEALTKELSAVLNRPAFFPLPAFIAKGLLGQMADETLLANAKVCPAKLQDSRFFFQYPQLKEALTHLLRDGNV
ncbi:MAG: TIGR01777 family oxidoreductase [Parachlamydiaceae bacterium]